MSEFKPIRYFISPVILISLFFLYVPHNTQGAIKIFGHRAYMDQVVRRKTNILRDKCHISNLSGHIFIEVRVSHQGKTKSRLVDTDLKDSNALKCILSIFNRIQFQKLKREIEIQRIYHFVL